MTSFRSRRLAVLLFAVAMLQSPFALAQKPAETQRPARVEVPTIAPRAEDVSTLDGIVKAFYETVSGPAGKPRQWARDRTLYIQGVRFVSTSKPKGKIAVRVMDHQAYVDSVNEYFVHQGFFEQEIGRVTRIFGNITHVFSAYESRQTLDGPVTGRGVNSIELFFDGKRWWIAAASWDDERPDNPIPKDWLP